MTTLTPEQANFDHFVGTLERLETNDQFLAGDGNQAFDALNQTFTMFREARDAGAIGDDEWGRIKSLTEDRATAYRVAKGESGRLEVFNHYQPQTRPAGNTSADLQDWIDREKSIMAERPDAPLYAKDFDYAADLVLTNKIRAEENPDGSNAIWDNLKRFAGGAAGTAAMAVDSDGDINKNIDRWLATDPSRDENFISEVSSGLGSVGASMAVFVAGAGLTKNPLIGGTMASVAFNGMVRYNEGYKMAKDLGAPEAVAAKAGMYATPAAFVDTVGDMLLAGRLGAGVAKTMRLGGGVLPRNAMLNRLAYGFVEQGTGQAASEVAGDLTASAGQSVATGNAKIWSDALAQAPRTAAVSFVLGGLLGGAAGIKEGAQINSIKSQAEALGVNPMDMVKMTKSGKLDMDETLKALEQAKLDKAKAQDPNPKPDPVPAEGAPVVPKPEPAPEMQIKTWADAFKTPITIKGVSGGAFELTSAQERDINAIGAKIDELTEERDKKERAGVPASELGRYNEAMKTLMEGMMGVANQKSDPLTETPDTWARYQKGGQFRSAEEARQKVEKLAKKSLDFAYQPIKVDPGNGTAFHYELQRRPKRITPFTGETIARAREIELAFRDADQVKQRFDEAIAAVEANQATDVTADTINRLLGLPPVSASLERAAGPFERGSDVVAARQAMESPQGVIAKKENGQWYLFRKTPGQAGTPSQTRSAEEAARGFPEPSSQETFDRAPIKPEDLIPSDEDFGLEVEREINSKLNNVGPPNQRMIPDRNGGFGEAAKRTRKGADGSVLLPGGEDFKQAARDGANFFRSGIQKFGEWSEAMVEKWGEGIRENLQVIWDAIKDTTARFLGQVADRLEQATAANPFTTLTEQMIMKGMKKDGKIFGRITPAADGTVPTTTFLAQAKRLVTKAELMFIQRALTQMWYDMSTPDPRYKGSRIYPETISMANPEGGGGRSVPTRFNLADFVVELNKQIKDSVMVRDLSDQQAASAEQKLRADINHKIDTNPKAVKIREDFKAALKFSEENSAWVTSPSMTRRGFEILRYELSEINVNRIETYGVGDDVAAEAKVHMVEIIGHLQAEDYAERAAFDLFRDLDEVRWSGASARYDYVNPKKLEEMQDLNDIIIVDPSRPTHPDEFHFDETPEQVVAFTRTYSETTDKEGDTLFVFELQSDRTKDHRLDQHPLVENFEMQMLKVAIDRARRAGKKYVAITDSKTAMITEGHDREISKNFATEEAAEAFGKKLAEGDRYYGFDPERAYVEKNKKGGYNVKAVLNKKATPEEVKPILNMGFGVSRAPGMNAAYGERLQDAAKKLTGSKGKKVDFGEHQNAGDTGSAPFGGKKNITAFAYDISNLNPEYFTDDAIIMRSGIAPRDLKPAGDYVANLLRKAQSQLEGAQEIVTQEGIAKPAITPVAEAAQRNAANPDVTNLKQTGTFETVFARGWRQGVREMRAGSKNAAKTLRDLMDKTDLKGLSQGEFATMTRLLSHRNITTEDQIYIEELGEVVIAAASQRERLEGMKKKRSKARGKLDTATLGIAIVENTQRSPLLGIETVIQVAQQDQPVVLAKAITSLTPAEAALIENNPDRPFPGFLDAYEAALDLINASTRASQVDGDSFRPLIEQLAEYYGSVKKKRLNNKLNVIKGSLSRAEGKNDSVDKIRDWVAAIQSNIATAETSMDFDAIGNDISSVLADIEKLPSVVKAAKDSDDKKKTRRDEAIATTVSKSKDLGNYIRTVKNTPGAIQGRGIPEPLRSEIYDAFSDISPKILESLSTADIEGIADVIDQIKRLADVNQHVDANFNSWARRIMGNLGAEKMLEKYNGEIEAMYELQKPSTNQTPGQKFASTLRNNPFVRYLTGNNSIDVKEASSSDLDGAVGLLNESGLLHVGKLLGADDLVTVELVQRPDTLRTTGQAKAEVLMVPISEAAKKLKAVSAAQSPKVRAAMDKRGLNNSLQGVPILEGLKLDAKNTRAWNSQTLVAMAMRIRDLDMNGMREKIVARLNVSDPMIQWIEGGHEKGSEPTASGLEQSEQKRLKDMWEALTEAAGGNTWFDIQKVLTPEQEELIKHLTTAFEHSGRVVRSTSAVMRGTILPFDRYYFPMQGTKAKNDNITDDEVLNARLDAGSAFAPATLRPGASHARTQWTQPQGFDLVNITRRHLIAVHVDGELTLSLYKTEIFYRKLHALEKRKGVPATTKWQSLVNGLRRQTRRVSGLDVALSSMFMSGGHRGLTAIQQMTRRAVLATLWKPVAEMMSLGFIFSSRLGVAPYQQAVRDFNQNKDGFLGLLFDAGSTFLSRAGWNSGDAQIIDHGSYRGIKMRPTASVIESENPEIRPGVWGWIQETKASKLANYSSRWLTSVGDHAVSGPAMYNIFMDQFRQMIGKPFNWQTYYDGGYDQRMIREVMIHTDIAFQKLAAPNTSGLVSALRSQSSTSSLVRLAKNILFPYSHFAANEKANFFGGLRRGFSPNSAPADRIAGFKMAATHAAGNIIYQMAMYNMGKFMVAAAGGALANAFGDDEEDQMALKLREFGEQFSDPEMHLRKATNGLIDVATGGQDPWTRGLIGWTINQANKQFTEKALARPYDPFKDDIVYVRAIDTGPGVASYLVGPYSKLIEDFSRGGDNLAYLFDKDKKGAGPQRALELAGLLGSYTIGLPAQTTINKVLKESTKDAEDPDFKEFHAGLKTQEINNNIKFIVDKRGNTPEAMASYLRSLNDEAAIKKAIKYYGNYAKEKKAVRRDVVDTARAVLQEFQSR